MLFRKKKAADLPVTYPYGFVVPEQPDTVCSGRILVCFIKGLLIFAACMGTIGSVISSFDLPCNTGALTVILLVLSIIMAFLHYSRHLFNIFYPVIFVGFTYFIFTFRYMVNSGYQAFVNILQQTYGDYYLLDIYRESTEYFTDRVLTITFAAGFIGFFLILLLNIFISEYMSVFAVILTTFPIFQMGLFIEKQPDQIYLVMLLFSYFMVGILRCSRHFLLPYRDKKWTEFKLAETDKTISYRYHASGKIFLQLTALFFVFAIIVGIIALPMMSGNSNSRLSRARRKADEYMSVFTSTGLSAFFDRYQAKGGISGGQLGGVSSVRPDYQTDLVVSFVPYSYESLYLKAYTGSIYTGNSWDSVDYDAAKFLSGTSVDPDEYENFISTIEGYRQARLKQNDPDVMRARIRIRNMDAEPGYYYIPYYVSPAFNLPRTTECGEIYPDKTTASLTDTISGITNQDDEVARGGTYVFEYYPYAADSNDDETSVSDPYEDENPVSFDTQGALAERMTIEYTRAAKEFYTQIPDSVYDYLYSLHDQIGTGKDAFEQADLIREYLEQFPYSQTPGTTPRNEDFVRYFLETQKRGYCAHFASAATLLLRSYGIPARYIEGYVVNISDISEGIEENVPYDEWFDGKNPLGRTGVVTVNVPDGNAHAWVEIYDEKKGWVPCEFTTSSEDDDQAESYSGFWDVFSGLFSLAGRAPDTVNNQSQTRQMLESTSDNVKKLLSGSVLRPFLIFIMFMVSVFVLYKLIICLRSAISMQFSWQRGDHSLRIIHRYKKLCRLIIKTSKLPENTSFILPTHLDTFLEDSELEKIKELLLSCFYSEKGISRADAEKLLLFMKDMGKQLKKKR
ncbi:MAG: hypothetical protein J5842_09325 [Lachnospiraceae bacterium]|nr:hypothetical protein [Lachnospiraceae bacterium]